MMHCDFTSILIVSFLTNPYNKQKRRQFVVEPSIEWYLHILQSEISQEAKH